MRCFAYGSHKKAGQELLKLRWLPSHCNQLLKPTIPPPNTLSDFACSVSSLGHFSLHYRPGHFDFNRSALAEHVLGQGRIVDAIAATGAADA